MSSRFASSSRNARALWGSSVRRVPFQGDKEVADSPLLEFQFSWVFQGNTEVPAKGRFHPKSAPFPRFSNMICDKPYNYRLEI